MQAKQSSASSTSKLVFDRYNNTLTDEQQLNQQPVSIKKMQDRSQMNKKTSGFSVPQSSTNKSKFGAPHGTTTASIILWYVCICMLFVIAFLALVLSVLYFLNDSSTEQVIKLYGITGSGSLAIVTFVIVFLDCCNDSDREDNEEEAIYRILHIKETRDKELARRRNRRVVIKEEDEKPSALSIQRSPQVPKSPPPPTCHHYHYPRPHHIHHIHSHSRSSYNYPYACSYCYNSHTPRNYRYNQIDVGVDTSDSFEPISRSKTTIHKSTRDAQTERKLWDAEHGTQTDRIEGTQTSTMELSGIPNNATEIIRETTILKAPRNLIPTLKQSMEQQDKDIAHSQAVANTNSMVVADV